MYVMHFGISELEITHILTSASLTVFFARPQSVEPLQIGNRSVKLMKVNRDREFVH